MSLQQFIYNTVIQTTKKFEMKQPESTEPQWTFSVAHQDPSPPSSQLYPPLQTRSNLSFFLDRHPPTTRTKRHTLANPRQNQHRTPPNPRRLPPLRRPRLHLHVQLFRRIQTYRLCFRIQPFAITQTRPCTGFTCVACVDECTEK